MSLYYVARETKKVGQPCSIGCKKCILEQYVAVKEPNLGPYSQNFLQQILKTFVTLGLNILRFYKPKASVFSKQISVKVDVI
jgi:hypothetical protein